MHSMRAGVCISSSTDVARGLPRSTTLAIVDRACEDFRRGNIDCLILVPAPGTNNREQWEVMARRVIEKQVPLRYIILSVGDPVRKRGGMVDDPALAMHDAHIYFSPSATKDRMEFHLEGLRELRVPHRFVPVHYRPFQRVASPV